MTFDVLFDPLESAFTAEEALLQIFAFSGPVRLRDPFKTRAQYVCGNYDQIDDVIWVGEIELQRTAKQSTVYRDERGNRFVDAEGDHVTTSEDRSAFAYNPAAKILVYRDRASIPYTRLRSFVEHAADAYNEATFSVDIVPQTSKLAIIQAIEAFSKVLSVSATYRHSQSPGDDLIDDIVDELNAGEITETVKAREGEALNKKALTGGRSQIAHAINHVQQNEDNGRIKVGGVVGGEYFSVDSRTAVARRSTDVDNSRGGIAAGLAAFAKRFPKKD